MLLLVRAEQRAPERVPSVVDRYFGRRSTLLHLSGCPCRYHRRVVAAKSTTSKYLFRYFGGCALSRISFDPKGVQQHILYFKIPCGFIITEILRVEKPCRAIWICAVE